MVVRDMIKTGTVVRRSDSMLSSDLGDETIMMDMEKGLYYGLDAVGTRIWQLVEQPIPVCRLCEELLAEYEVSPEACEQEVAQFLTKMLDSGIVEIVEEAEHL